MSVLGGVWGLGDSSVTRTVFADVRFTTSFYFSLNMFLHTRVLFFERRNFRGLISKSSVVGALND